MAVISIHSAIRALLRGQETEEERREIREALESDQLTLVSGDRAVAVGGSVEGAIITGDNNLVLSLDTSEAIVVEEAFERLLRSGGSILIIEHNMEVIRHADWVIDLGPEGGSRGGKIVGIGPPEAIAKLPGSFTGKYLARVLHGHGASGSNGHS